MKREYFSNKFKKNKDCIWIFVFFFCTFVVSCSSKKDKNQPPLNGHEISQVYEHFYNQFWIDNQKISPVYLEKLVSEHNFENSYFELIGTTANDFPKDQSQSNTHNQFESYHEASKSLVLDHSFFKPDPSVKTISQWELLSLAQTTFQPPNDYFQKLENFGSVYAYLFESLSKETLFTDTYHSLEEKSYKTVHMPSKLHFISEKCFDVLKRISFDSEGQPLTGQLSYTLIVNAKFLNFKVLISRVKSDDILKAKYDYVIEVLAFDNQEKKELEEQIFFSNSDGITKILWSTWDKANVHWMKLEYNFFKNKKIHWLLGTWLPGDSFFESSYMISEVKTSLNSEESSFYQNWKPNQGMNAQEIFIKLPNHLKSSSFGFFDFDLYQYQIKNDVIDVKQELLAHRQKCLKLIEYMTIDESQNCGDNLESLSAEKKVLMLSALDDHRDASMQKTPSKSSFFNREKTKSLTSDLFQSFQQPLTYKEKALEMIVNL